MADVGGLFSQLFTYVLLFEQSIVSGQAQRSFEQVRDDIKRMLQEQQRAMATEGMLESDCQNAAFAVVAWVDETIMKLSVWEYVNRWRANPLQRELFDTQNAGELFFDPHLKGLRADQKEIREVYYLALGLGFTGRYGLEVDGERTLVQLRQAQAPHLPMHVEEIQSIDKFTPQPYEVPSPPPPDFKRPWTDLLLKAGLALLVIVPLVLWLIHILIPVQFQLTVRKSGSGSGTVTSADGRINCGVDCSAKYARSTRIDLKAVPDPGSRFKQWSGDPGCSDGKISLSSDKTCAADFEPEPPMVQRWPDEKIRQAILERLANQPCAKIGVAVQAGVVSLSGRVASETQRGEVRSIAQSTQDVVPPVSDTFDIIPRPFCQVLDLLEPFKEHGEKQGFGLTMRLDKPGDRPVYKQYDNLTVTIQTPTKFASYVYVDYYTEVTQSAVGHVTPNRRQKLQALAPGSTKTVDLDSGLNLVINAPFGLELITVIASKTPLFGSTPRDDIEPSADTYLTELRRALPNDVVTSEVGAVFSFIITRP